MKVKSVKSAEGCSEIRKGLISKPSSIGPDYSTQEIAESSNSPAAPACQSAPQTLGVARSACQATHVPWAGRHPPLPPGPETPVLEIHM